MRFLAMYTNYSLAITRRVKAPLSVLATRGHSFGFMQVDSFQGGLSLGVDVTILPNWVLSEEEVDHLREMARLQHRLVVSDISEPVLLEYETVRRQIKISHLVTVPNEWMRKEVALINGNVAVIPSAVDVPYMMQGNLTQRPSVPHIACFGPFDWHLVRDAIKTVKEKRPKVVVMAEEATAKQLDLGDLVQVVDIRPDRYPALVHACQCALAPVERLAGQDRAGWQHEFGMMYVPVLSVAGNQGQDTTERWITAIEEILNNPQKRAARGELAWKEAQAFKSTEVAGQLLALYRKKLPHSLPV